MRLVALDREDRERLNGFVLSSPLAHFKQLYEWGEILEYEGTRAIRLGVERDGVLCASVVLYVRRLPGSPFTFLSGSRGPVFDAEDRRALGCLIEGVREVARKCRAIFVRVDPDVPDSEPRVREALLDAGFSHLHEKNWSSLNDPRIVMRLDLTAPESEMLSRLRATHRYHIRGIEKKGVRIRDAVSDEDVAKFHRVWSEVGARKGFPVRGLDYYRRLSTLFVQRSRGRLLLAENNDNVVAVLLALGVGRKAWVLSTGLTASARKLHPNEAIWWETVLWAKRQGARVCDFGGTGTDWPPEESSPGYPVFHFKQGFGAEAVYLTGYYDLVLRPRLYRLFRLAEERLLPRAGAVLNLVEKLRNKR